MFPESLQTYIKVLEVHDDLHRVSVSVDTELEIAAIVDRVCKGNGTNKALLFNNVKGASLPVAVNLFGSLKRMALALGAESFEKLSKQFRRDLDSTEEITSSKALGKLLEQHTIQCDTIRSPQWQACDCTTEGLDILPALKSWPLDGGKYLTMGQVLTFSPKNQKLNCGMYRIQIVDSHTALLRCHPGAGAFKHLRCWHKLDKPMPVVIFLGGPPSLTWAAGVSLPEDVSEVDFVHYLTGMNIPLSMACTSTIKVPANAEIVIEGHVNAGDELLEGPFGNHTGSYSSQSFAPVIKVDSVRMKTDAIYPCTVVGPPPMENSFMARAAARFLLQMLQYDHPWVCNVHMPVESIYHRAAMVTIASNSKLNPEEIKVALLNSQLLKKSRLLVLLDEGTVIDDMSQIYWHTINKLNGSHHADGIIIDARTSDGKMKVIQSPVIESLINKRWASYGL